MSKKLSPGFTTLINYRTLLEALCVCVILGVAILDALANLTLNQDSATYIVVAQRILISGHLESLINSTNFDNAPNYNPYISQPPGYPLLLVPFTAVLRNLMLSAVVSQVFFIVLFFLAVYLLASKLKFSPFLRVVALLLFTFIEPFLLVHRRIATETIFIALSIAAAYVAVGLVTKSKRKWDWILFGALVALSSMVRYTGLANLALLAPILLKWDTVKAAWRLITHRNTMIGLMAAGGLIIGLACLFDLLPGTRPGLGPSQVRGILFGAAAMITGAVGLIILRIRRSNKNLSNLGASGLATGEGQVSVWPLATFLACFVPTLLWFARNKMLYGGISPANNLLGSFHGTKFWDPVIYFWNDLLGTSGFLRPLLALLIVLFLILPFLKIKDLEGAGYRKTAQMLLLLGAGGHLALLWFLSLVTKIEPIRWRLFSPILAFVMLGMLNGVQHAGESVRLHKWRQVIALVPLVFLLLSGPFTIPDFLQSAGKVNYPVERQLWIEIDQIAWTRSASYFYSDYSYSSDGYLHQIFSNKPQGLFWDQNAVRNPEIIQHILTDGVNTFLVVTENGRSATALDKMTQNGTLPLQKIVFPDTGFALYYLPKK